MFRDLLAQIKRKGTDIMSMLAKVQPQLEEPSVSDSSMSLIQEVNYSHLVSMVA